MRRGLLLTVIGSIWLLPLAARADQPPVQPFDLPTVATIIKTVLISQIEPVYEDDSKWGTTEDVFAGVKVRRDGWKLRISKRKKEVRHGLWKKYQARIHNPERDVELKIRQVRATDNGSWRMDIVATVNLEAIAVLHEYVRDVRLFSVTVAADTKVTATLDCELIPRVGGNYLLTDLILEPKVVGSKLQLHSFTLKRVGKARGKVVRELGDELEGYVREKLANQAPKITKKANKALDKELENGQIRLSAADLAKDLVD